MKTVGPGAAPLTSVMGIRTAVPGTSRYPVALVPAGAATWPIRNAGSLICLIPFP